MTIPAGTRSRASGAPRVAFAAALAALASACFPFGAPATPDGYRRVEGGIVIPNETGPYDVALIEESPNVLIGTHIQYVIPKGETQTLPPFDLFVYPMAGRELDDEIVEARQALRTYDEMSPDVEGTTLGPTVTLDPVYAPYPIHMTPIRVVYGGQPARSFMYLTRIGQRFLKVRVSYAATNSDAVDRAMHRRVELLIDDIARQTD